MALTVLYMALTVLYVARTVLYIWPWLSYTCRVCAMLHDKRAVAALSAEPWALKVPSQEGTTRDISRPILSYM
jgi:hypothetical protein